MAEIPGPGLGQAGREKSGAGRLQFVAGKDRIRVSRDAPAVCKGLQMTSDMRNTKVVIALIVAMSSGAVCLRWLQPTGQRAARAGVLAARLEQVEPITSVLIEYVSPERRADLAEYECVISADGTVDWRATGDRVRILVLGSGAARLPRACAEALLAALGDVISRSGSAPVRVELARGSDPRRTPDLPPEAQDLLALLVRKAIVR